MSREVASAVLILLVVTAAAPARAQQLVVTLSTPEVPITSSFTGIDVALFGAIEQAGVPDGGPYDIVAVLRGPTETVVVRRKEPILGIWVNRDEAVFAPLPAYYAMHSTRPPLMFADANTLASHEIGLEWLSFPRPANARAVAPADLVSFRSALVRLRNEERLFVEQPDAITFAGTTIFQTSFHLPATVPIGRYQAIVFLFRGGSLIDQAETALTVTKTGFEQLMAVTARDRAVFYGLACVALALLTGWLAGIIFRRD